MQMRAFKTMKCQVDIKNLSFKKKKKRGVGDMTERIEYLGIVRVFCVREGQATEPGSTVPRQGRSGGGETGGGLQGVIGFRERGPRGDTLLTRH